jgi:hypothetical protein
VADGLEEGVAALGVAEGLDVQGHKLLENTLW